MMSYSYLLLILVTVALGLGAQGYIKSMYHRYRDVPISTGLTGAETARRMLDANGLSSVRINAIDGELTDNFDPKAKVLSLSRDIYEGRSVAAAAVACHEAGHAVQHARDYVPAKMRGSLVPMVNVVSQAWPIVLIVGIFLNILGLVYAAIIFYAVAVVFQVVTLPVEFDASRRGLAYISSIGTVTAEENAGARKMLRAAALTYVAAALASLLQLIYLIGIARR
jgi:uncharacterized protein